MESAGVTLVKGDLAGIAGARVLSRATMRNIPQNLVLAFVCNVLGMASHWPQACCIRRSGSF
jgi:Cu+-exporting ATPase